MIFSEKVLFFITLFNSKNIFTSVPKRFLRYIGKI